MATAEILYLLATGVLLEYSIHMAIWHAARVQYSYG
jgi:hypothetical protein